MKMPWSLSQGMTLMELLMALGLGASLSAVIMQLFSGGLHLQSVQRAAQDLQQRSAYAQFLLRTAIRESASPCVMQSAGSVDWAAPPVQMLAAEVAAVDAVAGSQVLRLRTSDCQVPVHLFYIGRRGGDDDNPAGLFRRRQRNDGNYYASEELIEGVIAMTASAGIHVRSATPESGMGDKVAYVSIDQIADGSRVFSVNLTLLVQQQSAGRSIPDSDLSMTFSTALRQVEPRSARPDAN